MSKRWILRHAVMTGTLMAGAIRLSAQIGDTAVTVTASRTSEAAHVYKSEASVVAMGVGYLVGGK